MGDLPTPSLDRSKHGLIARKAILCKRGDLPHHPFGTAPPANLCKTCAMLPGSHSFELLKSTEENPLLLPTFYTCPAKATDYWDGKGIVAHMRAVLLASRHKKWVWHFDAQGFGLKHALEIGVAMELLAFFRDDPLGQALDHVDIVHANGYLLTMLTVALKPFLSPSLVEKIRFPMVG